MSKEFEQQLEERIGRDAGFRVPEGYFDEAFARVEASLPERRAIKAPEPTLWQKVSPYVYMVAMIAGIGLMIKTYHRVTNTDLSLDNVPAEIVQLASAAHPEYFEIIASSEGEGSIYSAEQDLAGMYDSFYEFEKDFEKAGQ